MKPKLERTMVVANVCATIVFIAAKEVELKE